MMKKIFVFVIVVLLPLFFLAQNNVEMAVKNSNRNFLESLSQQEIDKIKNPANGLFILNSTTGCINYFATNRWNELCGNCLPKPKPTKVDSIRQNGISILVYFTKNDKEDIFIKFPQTAFQKRFSQSPAVFKSATINGVDSLLFFVLGINDCGIEEESTANIYKIKADTMKVSNVYSMIINNKPYNVRDVANNTWMVDDYIADLKGNPSMKLFSVPVNKNVCPDGWSLPTKADWENYLKLFDNSFEQITDLPQSENLSIKLEKNGFWSMIENKIYFQNEMGMYWTNDIASEKATFLNLGKMGYMFVTEKPTNVGAKIRCIKAQ